MKFHITRTSVYDPEEQPCRNAYSGEWSKEDDRHVWYIDIDTIEQLMELRAEVGEELIIGTSWLSACDGLPQIEIYDTYRE